MRKFDKGNEAPTLQRIHKSAAKIQMGKTLYLLADTDKRNNIDIGAPVLAHRESTAMLTRETLTLWPMEMKAVIFSCPQTRTGYNACDDAQPQVVEVAADVMAAGICLCKSNIKTLYYYKRPEPNTFDLKLCFS